MEFKALPGPGKTTLSFVLPQEGFASLRIYDVRGALVRDLSGNYKEGMNRVEFVPDGSGTFFAILVAGGQQARTKFVTVK
ncbi:MAG: T9SS type A sorting domain-containing protein, partial [candidate division WOR-3 bacterium]